MALTVNPNLPVIAAQATGSATSGVVLQPGTVVDAQVLKVAENLVQIAIAGLSIDVMSEVALTPGQNLQLAVSQTADGTVRLAVVAQDAGAPPADNPVGVATNASIATTSNAPATINAIANPAQIAAPAPSDPLTPLERIAVSLASETAATQQQSLAPLFANLNAVATSRSLPPVLQQAVVQVLAQQTPLAPDLTGGDIAHAVQTSGLFLKSSLATGSLLADRHSRSEGGADRAAADARRGGADIRDTASGYACPLNRCDSRNKASDPVTFAYSSAAGATETGANSVSTGFGAGGS